MGPGAKVRRQIVDFRPVTSMTPPAIRAAASALAVLLALAPGISSGLARQGPPPPPPPRPGPGAPPIASGSAAISGVVVDATSKEPLADAVVALAAGGSSAAVERQMTDVRGRFVFGDLAARSDYTISVTRAGYFDGRYGPSGSRSGRPIALAEGEWFSEARVELVRPSAIAGRVVDERGESVVGVFVRALAEILVAGRPHLAVSQTTKTDDRGAYRLSGLAAGRYIVSVPSIQNAVPADFPVDEPRAFGPRMPGVVLPDTPAVALDPDTLLIAGTYPTSPPAGSARPQAYPTMFHQDARALADAAAVVVDTGRDRTHVDFQLRPVPAWRVSGRVQGPPDLTSGLLVRLVQPGAEDLGLGSEAATAVVDQKGSFTFLNVPAGSYVIDARRSFMEFRYRASGFANHPSLPTPGFRSTRGGGGEVFSAPEGTSYAYSSNAEDVTLWGRAAVDISDRDLSDLVVDMRPTLTISGRVVREPDDAPGAKSTEPAMRSSPFGQPSLSVHAEPADGRASLGMPAGSSSDLETFSVSGLLPGRYFLRVFLPGGGSVKSVIWRERDFTHVPFDTSNGQDFTDVVVTWTMRTAIVRGVVADFTASPNGAAVIVFPAEPAQWSSYGLQPRRLRSTAVSNDGSYQISVPAGDYLAVAVDGAEVDAWQDPKYLEAAARVATPITLGWGDTRPLNLMLRRAAR
jgi:hypothetical protein